MSVTFDQLLIAQDEVLEFPGLHGYGPLTEMAATESPKLAMNFATSLDGMVSFGGDQPSALHVTGGVIHDRFLMALLRSRADAMMVGAGTLWADPDHEWSARYICPEEQALFEQVRSAEGRSGLPPCVVVSHDGVLPHHAALFQPGGQVPIVATSEAGHRHLRGEWGEPPFRVIVLGGDMLNLRVLLAELQARGYERVVCEGGPRLYASLLEAAVPHDLYLTVCPLVIGSDGEAIALGAGGSHQPGLAPRLELRSIRSGGGQVFLRYQY